MKRALPIHPMITGGLCVAVIAQLLLLFQLREDIADVRRDLRVVQKSVEEERYERKALEKKLQEWHVFQRGGVGSIAK